MPASELEGADAVGALIILIAGLQFATFLLGTPPAATNLLLLAAVLVAAVSAGRLRPGRPEGPLASLAPAYACFVLYALILVLWIPNYGVADMTDWRLYHPNTAVYLGDAAPGAASPGLAQDYLLHRTPLFSLACSFLMSFLGRDFRVYQACGVLLNTSLFWGLAVLAFRRAEGAAARWALALAAVVPLLMNAIVTPTPKPLAAFFVILAWAHAGRLRRAEGDPAGEARRAALFASAAFMTHPSMLFYLLPPALGFLLRPPRLSRAAAGQAALVAAALIVPWFAWTITAFGWGALTPAATISGASLGAASYVASRFLMLLSTLVLPSTLVDAVRHPVAWTGMGGLLHWGDPLLRFQWETFLGGFTLSGLAFALAARRRDGRPASGDGAALAWAGTGALLCLAVHLEPDYKGHAANIMLPLAAVLAVELGAVAGSFGARLRWTMAALMGAEFAAGRLLAFQVGLLKPELAVLWYQSLRGGPVP